MIDIDAIEQALKDELVLSKFYKWDDINQFLTNKSLYL